MKKREKSDESIKLVEKAILTETVELADAEKSKREANNERVKRKSEGMDMIRSKRGKNDDLVITAQENAKLVAELIIVNEEIAKREAELVIANEEKVKRAAELVIANEEKGKRAAELVIANEEKGKRAAELVIANEEKGKRAAELVISNANKAKRAAELVIANADKAKCAAVLVIANIEKENRAGELIIADREIIFQNEEKLKLSSELLLADINKTKREGELVIANIEKATRAAEFVIANKELMLAKEKAKLVAELIIVNKELNLQITERILAEEALLHSNNFNKSLLNTIPFGMDIVDETGTILFQSDNFIKIFGERAIGEKCWELYRDDKVQCSDCPLFKGINIGETESYESHGVLGNRIFDIIHTGMMYQGKKAMLEIFQDITERKEIEKGLIESEERFQLLFNKAPLGYQSLDINGNFIDVNQQWLETLGYTREEVIGKWFGDFLSPDYKDGFRKRFPIFLAEGKIHSEFEMIHKNGKKLFIAFEGRISYDMNSKFKQTHCILQDITERKQLEENLQNSEIFLKETQVIANLGTYSMEVSSGKWKSSEILNKIFGIEPNYDKSVEGWTSIIHPDWQKIMKDYFILDVIGNKTKFDKEYKIIRLNDKAVRWVHGIGSLKFDEYNQPLTMIGTIQDITDKKVAELELIKAKEEAEESDRLKSAFLANMSHEIRTPMNGILGFTELLREPNLTVEEQQDFIQTIQISGARMLNTINNIVDVSKIESGLISVTIDETSINKKIEFIYKFFKPVVENKGLQFIHKFGLQDDDSIIRTDNEKVYGILTNLIKNAIKFTYEGSIEFGYEKKGAYLKFYVKDTGIGIPQKQQQIIFERFRQGSESNNRDYDGSGLGLSISKSYVEMLGGSIWVESREGFGSTFYFTIPYNSVLTEEKTSIENDDSEEHKEVQLKQLKILIVEDDEISYSLLLRTIQNISKEVLHAITGVEAVEACRNNPDLDLILMDIRMHRMNGLEATQKIRQFNKDVIIIAQTANAFTGDSEMALEAGCNDYISKPIDRTLLFELIKKHYNI